MSTSKKLVLGIEGGGTKTRWVIIEREGDRGRILREGRLPAANLKLIEESALTSMFRALPTEVTHVGAFLAGCGSNADRARLATIVEEIWPTAECVVGSDRESGFATAFAGRDGITLIAGTGSAVTGRKGDKADQAGGWGQLLGDIGGGYDLGLQVLRLALQRYDVDHEDTELAEDILRDLCLNRLEDLVNWAKVADKMTVARLAPLAFDAARKGNKELSSTVQCGARILAEYTRAVAHRLQFEDPEVKLLGGLFAHHAEYFDLVKDFLSDILPKARVTLCLTSGAMGAAWLAARGAIDEPQCDAMPPIDDEETAELASAATEQQNPASTDLDQLSTSQVIELFIAEEKSVTEALSQCRDQLEQAIVLASEALKNGGRLFYIGAGTSGRLGVLDASEIPPTFGASPELVQGVIAGGTTALFKSAEGAEDEPEAGAFSMLERGVKATDVVCGLAASGRTPFVLGALEKARALGAKTILMTCNPARKKAAQTWDVEIDLPTGPEIVTGSTRLKAGTATKLALNIISTCTMIRLGKVRGNLMADVKATNVKLRDRAIRLVRGARSLSYPEARAMLERNGWNVRLCITGDATT